MDFQIQKHSLKQLWILAMLFSIQNISLSLSFQQCDMCENNCRFIEDHLDYCYCESDQEYGIYGYQNVLQCKNVVESSYLNIDRNYPKIVFSESFIKHLTITLFTGVHNVREILLNGTEIEDIQVGAFSSLINIENLYLHENELHRVTRGCFNSLFHLKILDLHSNQINSIEEESFHGLNSLEDLNLGNNKLNNISTTLLSYLFKLKTFNITKNALKTIEFQFNKPSHIEILPPDIIAHEDSDSASSRIAVLDVSDNKISDLPKELFRNMKHLKLLDISKNDISDLKISMFNNLQELNTLSMHSLKLKNLEIQDFVLLSHLKVLNIKLNNLKFFKDDILNFCPDLVSMAIDGNQFSCSVVASMIMNSKQRNITIEYTQNYQNENIDGIQCVRKIENGPELSKNISDMLHDEIKKAFREILSNVSFRNISDGKQMTKLGSNEFFKRFKEIQNFTSMEKSLSNMTKIILGIKLTDLNVYSKILARIEKVEHNINIPSDKLLMNISRYIDATNESRDQFYNKFLKEMKRMEANTADSNALNIISYNLKEMKQSYENLYSSFYKATKNISYNTSEVENADFREISKSENYSIKNLIFEHLKTGERGNDEEREQMNSVTTKLNFLILFTVICYFIIFLIIFYTIGHKKLLMKFNNLKKREEICDEMSTLTN